MKIYNYNNDSKETLTDVHSIVVRDSRQDSSWGQVPEIALEINYNEVVLNMTPKELKYFIDALQQKLKLVSNLPDEIEVSFKVS